MIRLLHSATEWLHHPPPPRLGHLSGISRIRVLIKGLPEAEILVIREVRHHVYVKRQTRICTT